MTGGAPPGRPATAVAPYILRGRRRRLLVVSNCQTFSVVYCMQAMSDCVVDGMTAGAFQALDADARAALPAYDVIFAIPGALESGPGTKDSLIVALPHIYFPAFHPDLMRGAMTAPNGRVVMAPAGDSAIVTACFLHGLDVARTMEMFRDDVFVRLGYMEGWDSARDRLIDRCGKLGYDAAKDFIRWSAQGCFMYTANHPHQICLMDIAADALRRAGIDAAPCRGYVSDPLQLGPVFPVYDAIAAGYGVPGSFRFKPAGTSYSIGLADYIEVSFGRYRSAGTLRLSRYDRPSIDRITALLH